MAYLYRIAVLLLLAAFFLLPATVYAEIIGHFGYTYHNRFKFSTVAEMCQVYNQYRDCQLVEYSGFGQGNMHDWREICTFRVPDSAKVTATPDKCDAEEVGAAVSLDLYNMDLSGKYNWYHVGNYTARRNVLRVPICPANAEVEDSHIASNTVICKCKEGYAEKNGACVPGKEQCEAGKKTSFSSKGHSPTTTCIKNCEYKAVDVEICVRLPGENLRCSIDMVSTGKECKEPTPTKPNGFAGGSALPPPLQAWITTLLPTAF